MAILDNVIEGVKDFSTGYSRGRMIGGVATSLFGTEAVATDMTTDIASEATAEVASEMASEVATEEGANILIEALSFFFE
jgi:hypothetical protein